MSFTLPDIDLLNDAQPFTVVVPSGLQINQLSYFRGLNESPFQVQFKCGGINVPIPAWTDYPIQLADKGVAQGGASYPITLTWSLLLNVGSVPTQFTPVVYFRGETPPNTSPVALTRQVASTSVSTTSVSNTGSAPGTTFVFGQPSGDTSTNPPGPVVINNSGNETLGDQTYNGSLQVIGTSGAEIFLLGGTAPGGTKLTVLDDTSTLVASINDFGTVFASALALNTGSLTALSIFTASVTTSPTDFAHGLGVTPDIILLQVQGGVSTVRTVQYDPAQTNNTTTRLTGSSSFNVIGLALKK